MAESTRNMLVSIESESTEGTDVIAGSPSSFLAVNTASIIPQRTRVPNAGVRAVHSGIASKSYASHCDVSLSGYVTGKIGAAGTSTHLAALFKACGLKEVIDPGVSASDRKSVV